MTSPVQDSSARIWVHQKFKITTILKDCLSALLKAAVYYTEACLHIFDSPLTACTDLHFRFEPFYRKYNY